jgi:superfamily I DNA/RNA helicase
MSEVSTEQRQAVLSTAPRTLVMANPGSGKTRTAIARYQHYLKTGNASEAVFLTFTAAAAQEIVHRLEFADIPRPGFVGTLHAFALLHLNCLRRDENKEPFQVISEDETAKELVTLAAALKIKATAGEIRQHLLVEQPNLGFRPAIVAMKWRKSCITSGRIDFDTCLALFLLAIRAGKIPQPDLLIVDEYQDSASIDAHIYFALDPRMMFVVGDPNQSIFGFRGARIENILELEQMAGVHTCYLSTNYRSASMIVKAASNLIAHNRESGAEMKAATQNVGNIAVVQPTSEHDQITRLVEWVKSKPMNSTAILVRNNENRQRIEMLLSAHIAVQRCQKADPVATMALDAARRLESEGTPSSSYGAVLAARNVPPKVIQYIRDVGAQSGQLVAKIQELIQEGITTGEGVYIGTMHSAKGREWEHVAIADCVQQCTPGNKTGAELEAERRLFYVAITRARESLTLFAPESWTAPFLRGAMPSTMTQFIAEMSGQH